MKRAVTSGVQSPEESTVTTRRELRLRDVVFFNICAVASLRWVAAAAHAGPGSLVLWVIAALFFFLPSAIVVARLSEQFPETGGMYVWTKRAFGDQQAFLCAWFYFISNVLYLPSLVLAGTTMTAYVFGSAVGRFAEDRWFALPATLTVLWLGFAANFFGLRVAKWFSTLGGSSTFVIFAMLGIFAAGVLMHSGSVTNFDLLPTAKLDTLNLWSQIAFAFVGLELAPIMSGEMRNPRRDVPRAALISGILCALLYIGGTAAMLSLLTPEEISPMTGLAQAGAAGAAKVGAPTAAVLFAAVIAIALAGQVDTWIAGNTRLPYAIGLDRYLPAAFGRIHPRWGTPYLSLFVQVAAATIFVLMAQLGETVRSSYQIMVDMTVIATFIPFLYIFGAGFRFASRIGASSGLAVTLIAIALSMVPPGGTASAAIFEIKVVGGCAFVGVLGWFVFKRYEARRFSSPATSL